MISTLLKADFSRVFFMSEGYLDTSRRQKRSSWLSSAERDCKGGQAVPLNRRIDERKEKSKSRKKLRFAILRNKNNSRKQESESDS